MKWWNELPVYWKKSPEESKTDDYHEGEVEELTEEEIEELKARLVMQEMKLKDEL